ncbi:PREDICTED: uncharacterized protein LOC109209392 [Nicotiana attenuata]|uniref:uncharacterized protein LOC109209392 n=1 Tax=Nicotiana attenuata TaxID=49451 RepID=UPI0009047E05|nr:PREDICTED: uncharacterized protein LOC109209392 [Nicotiana attenuata]
MAVRVSSLTLLARWVTFRAFLIAFGFSETLVSKSFLISFRSTIDLYGAGLLGSLMYIRMLGNSVDSISTDGPKALIKGAAGQPRLLVPVVLVMIYNRWNGILEAEYGFMHLDLIPMLVGFFTYKIATFAQAIEDALTTVVEKKTET